MAVKIPTLEDLKNAIVVDTPNIIFYKKHKGLQQIVRNITALCKLITSWKRLLLIITPKLVKEFPKETKWLVNMGEKYNCTVISTYGHHDPDDIVLQIAKENKLSVLSNDKFRQKKYQSLRKNVRLQQFRIKNETIVY